MASLGVAFWIDTVATPVFRSPWISKSKIYKLETYMCYNLQIYFYHLTNLFIYFHSNLRVLIFTIIPEIYYSKINILNCSCRCICYTDERNLALYFIFILLYIFIYFICSHFTAFLSLQQLIITKCNFHYNLMQI